MSVSGSGARSKAGRQDSSEDLPGSLENRGRMPPTDFHRADDPHANPEPDFA